MEFVFRVKLFRGRGHPSFWDFVSRVKLELHLGQNIVMIMDEQLLCCGLLCELEGSEIPLFL